MLPFITEYYPKIWLGPTVPIFLKTLNLSSGSFYFALDIGSRSDKALDNICSPLHTACGCILHFSEWEIYSWHMVWSL